MEHSILSPSAMDRIINCPGSAVETPDDDGTDASKRGVVLHSKGEQWLGGEEPEFDNDDDRASVFQYVAYVRAHKSHAELSDVDQAGTEIILEDRIVSEILPNHGGTMDTLVINEHLLHVIDYKSGVTPVSAIDNKQLMSYLVLADEKYPGRTRFFASIVQPEVMGKPMCIEYSKEQLTAHLCDVMMADIDDSINPGSWCRWCPLRQNCAALEGHRNELARLEFSDNWPASKCLDVIAMTKVFTDMAKDAKQHLRKLMLDGTHVEGWKLARQLANRAWTDEDSVAEFLLEKGLDEDVIYNKYVISPAQLEKFSKSYKPYVNQNTHREEKGIIAVESSSNLEEYVPGSEFDNIEEDNDSEPTS